jgi:molybdenum cofactor biosynthesis enzyme MoaA
MKTQHLRFRIDKTGKSGAWINKKQCNLNCVWCHHDYFPHDGFVAINNDQFIDAIKRVISATKIPEASVRIAGDGEPTLVGEHELIDLIRKLHMVPEVTKVKMTTNGILIGQLANALVESKIDSLTISLNSLDEYGYQNYTGVNALSQVLNSIDIAYRLGLRLKINTIYWKYNQNQIADFESLSCKYNGMPIKFFDLLIQSYIDESFYLPLSQLENYLLDTGAVIINDTCYPYPKRIYKTVKGAIFEIKVAGRLNNCKNRKCNFRDICLEGCRHSVRIGLDGIMRPCGVRRDNSVDLLDHNLQDVDIINSLMDGGKLEVPPLNVEF